MSAKVRQMQGAWWVVIHHNGKRRTKRFGSTKADRRRADKVAEEINHRLALGLAGASLRPTEAILFDGHVRTWHRTYAPTFSRSYEHTASGLIERHLVPFFGSIHLRDITRDHLLRFVGQKLDEKLSRSTIANALSLVRRVMNLAVEDGLIDRSPANGIGKLMARVDRRVATEVHQVQAWNRDDIALLFEVAYAEEPRFAPIIALALNTGMRRGELLGLQWADVDMTDGSVSVRRAVVNGHVTTPKAGKARRVVIPPGAVDMLRALMAERRRQCLQFGWPEVPEWVFPSETGGPLDAQNFARA